MLFIDLAVVELAVIAFSVLCSLIVRENRNLEIPIFWSRVGFVFVFFLFGYSVLFPEVRK